MRTAIFVYQTTSLVISTCEPDLELCGMDATTVALAGGETTRTLPPGVYKIDSCHHLNVTGDCTAFEIASATKTNDPTPPLRASAFDAATMHAFLSTQDAKQIASP